MQCFQKSVCLLKNILSIVFSPQSPALFAEPLPGNPAFLAGPRPVSRHSLQGSPPCTRRPLLKKGSIRKLFCGWQHTFHGRAMNPEYRSRCSLGTDLWTPVPSDFAFTNLKKFLRVPRGVFSKTHPWQGVGQRPTKGEGKPVCGVRPFRRDGVP